MWVFARRNLTADQAMGGALRLKRVITIFPPVAAEKDVDPDYIVSEATTVHLRCLKPGVWAMLDVGNNNLPKDWGPSLASAFFRVQYTLVMRAMDPTSEEVLDAGSEEVAVPIWLSNNPGAVRSALAELSAGEGHKQEGAGQAK